MPGSTSSTVRPTILFGQQTGEPFEGRVDGQEPIVCRPALVVADDFVEGEGIEHLAKQHAEVLLRVLPPAPFRQLPFEHQRVAPALDEAEAQDRPHAQQDDTDADPPRAIPDHRVHLGPVDLGRHD